MICLSAWMAFSLLFGFSHTFPAASSPNSGVYDADTVGKEYRLGNVTFLSNWQGRAALIAADILEDSSYWYPKSSMVLPKNGCPVQIGWVHMRPAGLADESTTTSYEVRVKINFPGPDDGLLVTALINVGHVSSTSEVDLVVEHAFQLLGQAEAESLKALCYQYPVSIKEMLNLPVNTEPDPAIRRMLRRSDLDPDDYRRVEGLNKSELSDVLLRDSRIGALVIYRRSRIFVNEYTPLSETLGVGLVSLSIEYLDESYPDTLRSYEDVHLSLAIDGNAKRVYMLDAEYRSEPRKNLFPESDVDQFLCFLKRSGYSSKQTSEILESKLLRYLIFPHRGLIVSTNFDTCMFHRSLADESFIDLVESDSVLGIEAGARLLGPKITPNLYEVWRQLYGYDCAQYPIEVPKREQEGYTWKVWYRDNGQMEQFELVESKEGLPQLVRTILPKGDQ